MDLVSYSICILVLFGLTSVKCDVLVYRQGNNEVYDEFTSLSARFGPSLPSNGMRVYAVSGIPMDGCGPMENAPTNLTYHNITPKFVVVIVRGTCSFAEKVRNAQNASFDAVIVYNKDSNNLEIMSAADDSDIFIPSVFVGELSGKTIIYNNIYTKGYVLVLNDDLPFNINTHLILPFCVVVGLCFIIMLGFMVARCVRERRRILRYRLPTSSLKKLETRKFGKNEIYDTCAICLDDYEEGDRLRILPCRHAYHTKCIDVWLTKNRRVCPVCKRKVYTAGERRRTRRRRSADSTTDSMSSFEADDTTPLINPVDTNPNHGTFSEGDDEPLDAGHGMSDDEMLDGTQQQAAGVTGRFNPFDRVPNLPPQLANELNSTATPNDTSWSKFKKFFSFNRADDRLIDNTDGDDVDIIIRPNTSPNIATVSRPSSNNIMNANLSGSFRDDNDVDDEILDGRSQNASTSPRNKRNNSTPNYPIAQPSTSASDLPTSSSYSASPNNGIGVPAIPNINFNPTRQTSRRNDFV